MVCGRGVTCLSRIVSVADREGDLLAISSNGRVLKRGRTVNGGWGCLWAEGRRKAWPYGNSFEGMGMRGDGDRRAGTRPAPTGAVLEGMGRRGDGDRRAGTRPAPTGAVLEGMGRRGDGDRRAGTRPAPTGSVWGIAGDGVGGGARAVWGEGLTAQMQGVAARGQRGQFGCLRVHRGLAVVWSHPVVREC